MHISGAEPDPGLNQRCVMVLMSDGFRWLVSTAVMWRDQRHEISYGVHNEIDSVSVITVIVINLHLLMSSIVIVTVDRLG